LRLQFFPFFNVAHENPRPASPTATIPSKPLHPHLLSLCDQPVFLFILEALSETGQDVFPSFSHVVINSHSI
jgi:hypothetical protein